MPPSRTTTTSKTATTPPAIRHPALLNEVQIQSIERIAKLYFEARVMPNGAKTWQDVAAVMMVGYEVGFHPSQSLKYFYLNENKKTATRQICMYGDGPLALIRRSGLLVSLEESFDRTGESTTAVCRVQRKGYEVRETRYSLDDAKRAGLYPGREEMPWAKDPLRMLLFRARQRALRDEFADILSGAFSEEETEVLNPEFSVVQAPQPALPGTPTPAIATAESTPTATVPVPWPEPVAAQPDQPVPEIAQPLPEPVATQPTEPDAPPASEEPAPKGYRTADAEHWPDQHMPDNQPVTDELKNKIRTMKKQWEVSRSSRSLSPDAIKAEWLSIIGKLGLKTANDATCGQARKILSTLDEEVAADIPF